MILGIDLGTCNTLAATVSREGIPVLIPDSENKAVTSPSLLLIEGKKALAGHMAQQYMELYPDKNFIRYYKRHFGTQQPVYFDEKGSPWFSETVAAMMLKKVKFDAEMFQPEPVEGVVITVPAHYNDAQRKSVLEAARLAGLSLISLIEEPVAASLNYLNTHLRNNEIVLIYDFGGGTFDLTVVTRSGNKVHVLAKEGISTLGGKEFDEIISQRLLSDYSRAFGHEAETTVGSVNKLRKLAEDIKVDLCRHNGLYSRWVFLGGRAYEFRFSLAEMEARSAEITEQTRQIVDRCLRAIGIAFSDVNKIIMVGGTSQFPFLHSYWKSRIDPATQEIIAHDPMNAVAKGAAIYAAGFGGGSGAASLELNSVSTYHIALRNKQFPHARPDVLIAKNLPLPAAARRVYRLQPGEVAELQLLQLWDTEEDTPPSGTVRIGPFNQPGELQAELLVENKANGTLSLKLKDAATGKDLRMEYIKEASQYAYDYREQQQLLDSVVINNIF